MNTIEELKSTLPQSGKIEWIGIRPAKKDTVLSKVDVSITVEEGLVGDHYTKSGGKRMVTLIQAEHIDAVAGMLEKNVDPSMLRRNIVVRGINLNALHDTTFKIGSDVILEGTGYCHPCSRMEANLGPGGYNAMRGHGGITARVVKGGEVSCGDSVSLLLSE